jgi:uncharacterized protein YvpB
MSLTLKILASTILKRKPIPSSELPDDFKQSIAAGKVLELDSFTVERDHIRCFLAKDTFKDTNVWYVFGKHAEIRRDGNRVYPKAVPATTKLNIPYKSQRDNELNPNGSCNVTSLAMCLEFLGAKRKATIGQFEDELYDYAERKGLSRHDPHDLAMIVEAYGYRDDFRTDRTITQVKEWLTDNKPAVIHGYFTDFGHIVVLAGFDEDGFLVHDPYGEWYSWGYDRNALGIEDIKGKYVHYSYEMIKRLCIPDENFWVHFISKS